MNYLLVLLLVLPVVGAVMCAVIPTARSAKIVALITSLACLAIILPIVFAFDFNSPAVQFETDFGGVDPIGFSVKFGVNSIGLWLAVLTVFLQPLAIAASFESIQERAREYYAWMLLLLTAMLGVFLARDALLFYIFFELTLIPMFFIIGIWGGPERRYAAAKFFLFTFAGSIFTLAAVIYLGIIANSFDLASIIFLAQHRLSDAERLWVTLGFLAGFAVKVPLFPVHTWLPLAHTEAPTAGSVILAGVLLKLGTYGILVLALPIGFISNGTVLYPTLVKFVGILCLIGITYGALVAWVQQDIKKLVAYSSVSHLGFCVLGLAALNYEGVQGSILYMINHGLSTGALFLVVGMIYDRFHTRDINELSGLARRMPILAFFFILFTLSSIGLPGLNGFPSEFLTILGAFRSDHLGIGYGAVAGIGIVLGALYMLHMAARVIWGPLRVPDHDEHIHTAHGEAPAGSQADRGQAAAPGRDASPSPLPTDIGPREIGILIPLAVVVVLIGIIPGKLLDTFREPVRQLIGAADVQQPDGELAEAFHMNVTNGDVTTDRTLGGAENGADPEAG